jgi:3-oxoacyl-[acyl-carrier-protein] synthase III
VYAAIKAIEYHLPARVLANDQLAAELSDWSAEKIEEKTGIAERYVAAENECASDLGVAAARKLFMSGACRPEEIDYLLLCTQSPDYFLPTTACLMQERLGIPTTAGAIDFNQGCSGHVYGLGLAKGLVETGQARRVLLITAETYSKHIHPRDRSVRTLFGDAAAATLIAGLEDSDGFEPPLLGPFVLGTDGRGAGNLIVPTGGLRQPRTAESGQAQVDEHGNWRSQDNLFMNGPEIFTFTLRIVPQCVSDLLARAGKRLEDIDLFVFHQANRYMLEHLRKKLRIPDEKFWIAMRHCGNTVSSTIPIALKLAQEAGRLRRGQTIMLVGFGVGYSWGGALVRWV